jgi:hypothetical protein
MTIKYFEYSAKIEHGYLLGSRFDYEKVKAHEHMDHAPAEAAGAAHGDSVFAPAHVPAYVPPDKSAFLDAPRGPSGLAPRATEVKSHEAATAEAAPAEGAAPDGSNEKNTLPIDGRPRDIHLFFSIYFLMTGLHGIHVLIGMGVIAWLFFLAKDGRFGPSYFAPVEIGGLYWHLVDLIWIYLFPLLYLI